MFSPFRKKENPFQISIGIATFERRFEDYFVPLLTKIRSFEIDAEIVVAINGEHRREFGEDYRKRMLEFLSTHQKTFPIFFPAFRSLSKLWNTILIHASNESVLLLNDDTLITDGKFMNKISSILKKNGNRSFLINRSWSHFVARKEEIANLGYFDERLLGIGEEDGDMTWRYIREHGAPMVSHTIRGFKNYAEDTMTQQPENIACHANSKYSLFNRRFVHEKKYAPSAQGIKGMFDVPMEIKDEGPEQYPSERFYRENLDEL